MLAELLAVEGIEHGAVATLLLRHLVEHHGGMRVGARAAGRRRSGRCVNPPPRWRWPGRGPRARSAREASSSPCRSPADYVWNNSNLLAHDGKGPGKGSANGRPRVGPSLWSAIQSNGPGHRPGFRMEAGQLTGNSSTWRIPACADCGGHPARHACLLALCAADDAGRARRVDRRGQGRVPRPPQLHAGLAHARRRGRSRRDGARCADPRMRGGGQHRLRRTARSPRPVPNRHASSRDHVAVYVVRRFHQTADRSSDREIVEARFFRFDSLPDGTTPARWPACVKSREPPRSLRGGRRRFMPGSVITRSCFISCASRHPSLSPSSLARPGIQAHSRRAWIRLSAALRPG